MKKGEASPGVGAPFAGMTRLVAWCLLATGLLGGCGVGQSQKQRCKQGAPGFEGQPTNSGREGALDNCTFFLLGLAAEPQTQAVIEARLVTAAACVRLYERLLECDRKNPLPFSAEGL